MKQIIDSYTVRFGGSVIGSYYTYSDGTTRYNVSLWITQELSAKLSAFGLGKETDNAPPHRFLDNMIRKEKRVPGRRRVIYKDGEFTLERVPQHTGESFSVYRRDAGKNDPDYSPLPHDAPHSEGPHTPEGMREWASHYSFNKMDDGTYEAELDEAWCWGGGHNDGGTIHAEIPEEWLSLPYDGFLCEVVRLAAAAHYGFTPEILKSRAGLKEFFGY